MVKLKNKRTNTLPGKSPVRRRVKISFGRALRAPRLKTFATPEADVQADVKRKPSRSASAGTALTPSATAERSAIQFPELVGQVKGQSGVDLTEKVKELIGLAREQGYLTYDDIADALADLSHVAEDLDEVHTRLSNLDIEIVDQAELESAKQAEPEEEEDKTKLDCLDDPVRMYMRQMGKVPLLTREQEVAICKRIEDAEIEMRRIIYSFGFTGKEHIALAEKLISEPPKERFDRVIVDTKIEGREKHLKVLRQLVKRVRALDEQVDRKYADWRSAANRTKKENNVQHKKTK
jgi:RNA polymerase primary sigma factor